LNNSRQWPINALDEPPCVSGRECSKKHALSLSEGSIQQGRSPFDARSVPIVREHGKKARTPLAAFFNIPRRGFPDPWGSDAWVFIASIFLLGIVELPYIILFPHSPHILLLHGQFRLFHERNIGIKIQQWYKDTKIYGIGTLCTSSTKIVEKKHGEPISPCPWNVGLLGGGGPSLAAVQAS